MIRAFRSVPEGLREWQRWISQIETQGTATISLTGFGSAPSGDIEWVLLGRRVVLHAVSAITGTSNATSLTMTGIPSAVTPENTKIGIVPLTDAGGTVNGLASISSTTITFSMGSPYSTTGFTASSTKGIPAGWQFSYILDS